MILEGILTTRNADHTINIAPMGPRVDRTISRLRLRPFPGSRSFENLRRTGEGIFHVTDNIELLAQAAVGDPDPWPALEPCALVDGSILSDACRWYAFRIRQWEEESDRPAAECEIVGSGWLRDFFGWNRAMHAVLEAAILATRLSWSDEVTSERQLNELAVIVAKTAGEQEQRAFRFLQDYVRRHWEQHRGSTG